MINSVIVDDTCELTFMQKKMFICNRMPIYRLPMLYELNDGVTYESVQAAAYHTFKAHPALQVKYEYDPSQRQFYQRMLPLREEQFQIPIHTAKEDVSQYIINRPNKLDLSRNYPWACEFIEDQHHRYLYIEFHHICMDGLGIRSFERTFINQLHGIPIPSSTEISGLTTYKRICTFEQQEREDERATVNNLKLPEIISSSKEIRLNRFTQCMDEQKQAVIARIAKMMNVTKGTVYQGLMEEVWKKECVGEAYGAIGNWRSQLGNLNEVGCFVNIQPQFLNRDHSLEERTKAIFNTNWRRFMNPSQEVLSSLDFSIVFSYEEDMFQYFRYIPVDQLCKFDLYVRVYSYDKQTHIEFEYNRGKYSEDQMMIMYKQFESILDQYVE
ncbi:condensation domain-containing protein [Paenibacillus sp. N1-5-1-14]|uniref:condensation domain-containing protein n=1 Tax=Paenibacillus radicibacter TaxID=2972488 RepID=UPI0021591807|nr:condensation domain-containing protein [Paenibacillus radicibacter]MCR8644639.1 condensation domain-containing protein [Paenibacillus radicibacter]